MKKHLHRAEKVASLREAISSEPTLRNRMGFNGLPIAQVNFGDDDHCNDDHADPEHCDDDTVDAD